MIVDAYSHVCPAPFLQTLLETAPSSAARGLKNSYLWDADRRLRFMDALGVETQVLVLVRPPVWLGMERGAMHGLTRLANETIAAFTAAHPDRFIGIAVLPVVDEETLAEARRAWQELGLRGAVVFSNVEGRPLDHASMWPLYEEAAAADVPIWIHPQDGHSYPWLSQDQVDHVFGWPFETSIAMARLVYGGVLDRYPNLKFVTHHLGGMVPFYAGRIAGQEATEARSASSGPGRPDEGHDDRTGPSSALDKFRKFYCDTMVTGWRPALECGIEFFGVERIMFGADFPMGPGGGEVFARQVLSSIQALEVGEEGRKRILGENLLGLLGISAAPSPPGDAPSPQGKPTLTGSPASPGDGGQ